VTQKRRLIKGGRLTFLVSRKNGGALKEKIRSSEKESRDVVRLQGGAFCTSSRKGFGNKSGWNLRVKKRKTTGVLDSLGCLVAPRTRSEEGGPTCKKKVKKSKKGHRESLLKKICWSNRTEYGGRGLDVKDHVPSTFTIG